MFIRLAGSEVFRIRAEVRVNVENQVLSLENKPFLPQPPDDDSVRPGGIACRLNAWEPGYSFVDPPGDLDLLLTEFPDPGGKAIYFRLQDLNAATDDELFRAQPSAGRGHPQVTER